MEKKERKGKKERERKRRGEGWIRGGELVFMEGRGGKRRGRKRTWLTFKSYEITYLGSHPGSLFCCFLGERKEEIETKKTRIRKRKIPRKGYIPLSGQKPLSLTN